MQIKFDRASFGVDLIDAADALEGRAFTSLAALKSKTCTQADLTGWFDWPAREGFRLADEITNWRQTFELEFDLIVVVGIGGSYLGSRAVSEIVTHSFAAASINKGSTTVQPLMVFAGHNMSETSLGELLDLMAVRKPLINVISKSGTTTEPAVAFRVIKEHMEHRYGASASRRIIATTDRCKGALRRLALESGYKMFEVPDSVGGRFSVLTAVGLVPLGLLGVDIYALLSGADHVFKDLSGERPAKVGLVSLQYAQCRVAAWSAGKCIEVMAYPEPKMRHLVEWWKQLFGESDGKQGLGMFPASIECTMDLHSMGQYMQEGPRTMIETFLAVDQPRLIGKDRDLRSVTVPRIPTNMDELQYLEGRAIDGINNTAMAATRLAHSLGAVPALEIRLADLSPSTLGATFAMFESACAIGGIMMGINPFNQPGVEAYKLKMFELLGKPKG